MTTVMHQKDFFGGYQRSPSAHRLLNSTPWTKSDAEHINVIADVCMRGSRSAVTIIKIGNAQYD